MTAERAEPIEEPAPVRDVPPHTITPAGREALKLYEREIATYLRELPRLLREGQEGRHVLVKDDGILGVWDKQEDAIQAGCERFGLDPIFVQRISPRDPERFALFTAAKGPPCRS